MNKQTQVTTDVLQYHPPDSEILSKPLYSQQCYRFDVYIHFLELAMYMYGKIHIYLTSHFKEK